jgi:hypothetical protein
MHCFGLHALSALTNSVLLNWLLCWVFTFSAAPNRATATMNASTHKSDSTV